MKRGFHPGNIGSIPRIQAIPSLQQDIFLDPALFWDRIQFKASSAVFLNSCPGFYPLIPGRIDSWMDILNPVQIRAVTMDPKQLNPKFGIQRTFLGCTCDTQQFSQMQNLVELHKMAPSGLKILGPSSGFVCATSQNVQVAVSPESIAILFDIVFRFTS